MGGRSVLIAVVAIIVFLLPALLAIIWGGSPRLIWGRLNTAPVETVFVGADANLSIELPSARRFGDVIGTHVHWRSSDADFPCEGYSFFPADAANGNIGEINGNCRRTPTLNVCVEVWKRYKFLIGSYDVYKARYFEIPRTFLNGDLDVEIPFGASEKEFSDTSICSRG